MCIFQMFTQAESLIGTLFCLNRPRMMERLANAAACAKDIKAELEKMREKVQQEYNIELERESKHQEARQGAHEQELLRAARQREAAAREETMEQVRSQREAERERDERDWKAEELKRQAQQIRSEKRRLKAESKMTNDVEGMRKALGRLKQHTTEREFRNAVDTLSMFLENVCTHPENATFKQIKEKNVHFHEALGRFQGGHECMQAAGFDYHDHEQDSDLSWFHLQEPDLEQDLDRWDAWFTNLKAIREHVRTTDYKHTS